MRCDDCGNTKEFVRKYIDTTLHIYDLNGDEADAVSIGYEPLPDSETECNHCHSINIEE